MGDATGCVDWRHLGLSQPDWSKVEGLAVLMTGIARHCNGLSVLQAVCLHLVRNRISECLASRIRKHIIGGKFHVFIHDLV